MSVGVSWLLQQKDLRLTRCTNPAVRPTAITFVHATELADPSPWLSGGELLLTTGLGLSLDPDDLRRYVDRLHEASVACLGFGVGLSHDAPPEPLIRRADEVGLDVLCVPFEVPFAAVVRTVMNTIAEQEYQHVLHAAKVQTRITRAALRGGVDAIVRELAIATSSSVAYVGNRAQSVHPPGERDLIDEVRALVDSTRHPGKSVSMTVSEPGRSVTVQPVGVSSASSGHLAMKSAGPPTGIDRILLGHAVSLVTLELEQPARLRFQQCAVNTSACTLLLDGGVTGERIAHLFDDAVDDDGAVRILLFHADTPSETLTHLDGVLASAGRALFSRTEPDGSVVVVLRGNDSVSYAEELLGDQRSVRAGLSEPRLLPSASEAYAQARMAAGMAGARREDRIVEFGRHRASVVLGSEAVRTAFGVLASSTVAVLETHDDVHGGDLVPSLRAYLEANGHWESAAGRIGVHRHTLRGRITKAQELLDLDLADARTRAELLLALLVSDTR